MPRALLTVEDVSKTYDVFKAISNLNFYLYEGELRVVIGPNGAGKSTFFDLITGRAQPDKGKIEFGTDPLSHHDLTELKEYEINRLGISRKFQTPSVYTEHTVWDNLVLSLRGQKFSSRTSAPRARCSTFGSSSPGCRTWAPACSTGSCTAWS